MIVPFPTTDPEPPPQAQQDRESRVAKIRAEVSEIMRKAGKSVPPDDLPPLPDKLPGPGVEPRDPVDIHNLIELRKKAAKLPSIENTADLLKEQMNEPPELVEGILHQGSKMYVGGASKSNKTWVLLDLALSVSSGVPWLGFITTKAKVLYCNFEIQREFIRKRIKAIKDERHITEDFDLWNLRGEAAGADVIIPLIIERIKTEAYGLIIIDPLYKLLGAKDENAAGDIASILNMLEKLAVKSKAAVVFADHFSKGNQAGKEHIDRVSGSGVKSRDADSILTFTSHVEKEAYVVEATLRNLKPVDPFSVRWQYPVMIRDQALNPSKLKTAVTKQAQFNEDQLIAPIAVRTLTSSEWKKAVLDETGMSKATFNRLLVTVKETPGVNFNPDTKQYSYASPDGAKLA
jgi:hypothetical protein